MSKREANRSLMRDERQDQPEISATLVTATFDASPVCGVFLTPALRIVRVNRAFASTVGLDEAQRGAAFYEGRAFFELFRRPELEPHFVEAVRTGVAQRLEAQPFVSLDHAREAAGLWDWTLTPVLAADGATVGLVAIAAEVTERVRAIERAHESEERLRAALRSRETLLRELNHRVKNNLAVVISLLQLEASRSNSIEVMMSLTESAQRVRAIALVHELLSCSSDFSCIDAREHLRRLIEQLKATCLVDEVPTIELDVRENDKPVWLDIEQAVPLSLAAQELLSNALRHAFEPSRGFRGSAQIRVSLRRWSDRDKRLERARLLVSDNGVGVDASVDDGLSKSLGLRLVKRLARQLGGLLRVERASPNGTIAAIDFVLRGPRRDET